MTTSWILGTASLYATTIGALLVFVYLSNLPRSADAFQSPQGKEAYAKHRRMLLVAMGLLSVWLVIQVLAIILL